MIDKDGKKNRSNIVFADFGNAGGFIVLNNPIKNKIEVLPLRSATSVMAELIDLAGKTMLTRQFSVMAGNIFTLDATNLAAGAYYLKLSDGQNTNLLKIVKQ